jgi:hypothetical protein
MENFNLQHFLITEDFKSYLEILKEIEILKIDQILYDFIDNQSLIDVKTKEAKDWLVSKSESKAVDLANYLDTTVVEVCPFTGIYTFKGSKLVKNKGRVSQ